MKHDINHSKTEFLFESDAEKVVLKEAAKPRRPKIYKKIIINSILISIVISGIFISLSYYEQNILLESKALIIANENNTSNLEKLSKQNIDLKTFNNNFSKKYQIIINTANPLTEEIISDYKLVTVNDNLFGSLKLEEETYNNYLQLKENLLKRGYYINIKSGFRSLQESELMYEEYEREKGRSYAERYVAKAGTSEHNAGLAIDFTVSTNKNATKTDYNSAEYVYLENIAYLYGFIVRYPKEKENITGFSYEPWHLRYVGKNLAKYLKKNNLTLEEYYDVKR